MRFSIAFLNCGRRPEKKKPKDWGAIATTLNQGIGNDLAILGLCEVYDNDEVPEIVSVLKDMTGRSYQPLFSPLNPPAPRLGILVDMQLGRLQLVGDDGDFRHGDEWRRWYAGRVEFFRPGTLAVSLLQLVIIVNHWDSATRGLRDTMANREILAWEVGAWMCNRDPSKLQVLQDADTKQPVPVYRQPSLAMGDFNCEPGSPELRSSRKFTLQAMQNQPELWGFVLPESKKERDTQALLYDLSWRKLTASPAKAMPGTYTRRGFHTPAMIDRMLVSRDLWDGPQMRVVLDVDGQAMRIIPAADKCSDHSAIAITVETK